VIWWRRFMCAVCGDRVEVESVGLVDEAPGCCEWEMVELPPADAPGFVGAA